MRNEKDAWRWTDDGWRSQFFLLSLIGKLVFGNHSTIADAVSPCRQSPHTYTHTHAISIVVIVRNRKRKMLTDRHGRSILARNYPIIQMKQFMHSNLFASLVFVGVCVLCHGSASYRSGTHTHTGTVFIAIQNWICLLIRFDKIHKIVLARTSVGNGECVHS